MSSGFYPSRRDAKTLLLTGVGSSSATDNCHWYEESQSKNHPSPLCRLQSEVLATIWCILHFAPVLWLPTIGQTISWIRGMDRCGLICLLGNSHCLIWPMWRWIGSRKDFVNFKSRIWFKNETLTSRQQKWEILEMSDKALDWRYEDVPNEYKSYQLHTLHCTNLENLFS